MKPAACAVDHFASCLAAHAGLVWTQLGEHPGYSRNMFREQARTMMCSMAAITVPPAARSDDDRGGGR